MANELGQYREELKNSAVKQTTQLDSNPQNPSTLAQEQNSANENPEYNPVQASQPPSSFARNDDQKPKKTIIDTAGSSDNVIRDKHIIDGGHFLGQSEVFPPQHAQYIFAQAAGKSAAQHTAASDASTRQNTTSEAKRPHHDPNSIQGDVEPINQHTDENDSFTIDGNKGEIKHERTNSAKKQPSYRKVESTFLKNKPIQVPPAKSTVEQAANTSVSPALAAGKPRLVPKSGRDNRSVVPGSKTGGSTGSDSGTVWNRQSKPSSKTLTDEELVKHYGISMTERLPSHEAENRSNWADIEDEESWNPAEAVMGIMDGTKFKPETIANRPVAPTEVEKPASEHNDETSQELKTTLTALEQSEHNIGSGKAILKPGGKLNTTQLKPGVKLRSAPEVAAASTDSSQDTSVKSPWAEVPKPDSASPINFNPVPALENKQSALKDNAPPVDQSSHTTLPTGPALPKEIDADDFNRAWRSEEKGSRELFDSRSGRYEPAKARRQSIRQESGQPAPPSVLQRSGHTRQPSHHNLPGGSMEESGVDGYVRANLNINIETAREQRRLRLEEEKKQEQAKQDRLRAKIDAIPGMSPQAIDARTEEESKNGQDLNTNSIERTGEKASTSGLGYAKASKVEDTTKLLHTSPGSKPLPTQPVSEVPSEKTLEYVQSWNKAWSNTMTSNPAGNNVWGPLYNDKMIGNGSWESTMKSMADPSSKPRPIGSPSTKPKEDDQNSVSKIHQDGSLMNNNYAARKAPSKTETPSNRTNWKSGVLATANTPVERSQRDSDEASMSGWPADWRNIIAGDDRKRPEVAGALRRNYVPPTYVCEYTLTDSETGKATIEFKVVDTRDVVTKSHGVAGHNYSIDTNNAKQGPASGNGGVKEVEKIHSAAQNLVPHASQATQKAMESNEPCDEHKSINKFNGNHELSTELPKATRTPLVKAQWKGREEKHKDKEAAGFKGWAQSVQEDDRKRREASRAAPPDAAHVAPVFQSSFTKSRFDDAGRRIVESAQASDSFSSNGVYQRVSCKSTQESSTDTEQQPTGSPSTTANGRVSRFFGTGLEIKPLEGDCTRAANLGPPSPPPDIEAGLFDDGEVHQILINLPNLGSSTHTVHSPKGIPKVKLPPTPVSPRGEKEPSAVPGRVQVRTGPQPIVDQAEWQMRFDGLLNRSFSGGVVPQSPMSGANAPIRSSPYANDSGLPTGAQPAISPRDASLIEPFSFVAAKPSEGELYDEPEHGSTPAVKLANIDGYYLKAPRPIPRGRSHAAEKRPEFSSTRVELQFFRFDYNGVMILLPGKDPRRDRKLLRSRPPRRPTTGKGTPFPKNKPNKSVAHTPQQGTAGGQVDHIKKDSDHSLFSKGRFHALSDGQAA